jgi:hypothetical protein
VREVRLDSLEKILIAERFLLDEAPAAHYRLHMSQVVKSPSLQKDAAWRAVLASKKFLAYERQSSSL